MFVTNKIREKSLFSLRSLKSVKNVRVRNHIMQKTKNKQTKGMRCVYLLKSDLEASGHLSFAFLFKGRHDLHNKQKTNKNIYRFILMNF